MSVESTESTVRDALQNCLDMDDPLYTRNVIEQLLSTKSDKMTEIMCVVLKELCVTSFHGSSPPQSKSRSYDSEYQNGFSSKLGTVPLSKLKADMDISSGSDVPSQSSESSEDELDESMDEGMEETFNEKEKVKNISVSIPIAKFELPIVDKDKDDLLNKNEIQTAEAIKNGEWNLHWPSTQNHHGKELDENIYIAVQTSLSTALGKSLQNEGVDQEIFTLDIIHDICRGTIYHLGYHQQLGGNQLDYDELETELTHGLQDFIDEDITDSNTNELAKALRNLVKKCILEPSATKYWDEKLDSSDINSNTASVMLEYSLTPPSRDPNKIEKHNIFDVDLDSFQASNRVKPASTPIQPPSSQHIPAWELPSSPLDHLFKKSYGNIGNPDFEEVWNESTVSDQNTSTSSTKKKTLLSPSSAKYRTRSSDGNGLAKDHNYNLDLRNSVEQAEDDDDDDDDAVVVDENDDELPVWSDNYLVSSSLNTTLISERSDSSDDNHDEVIPDIMEQISLVRQNDDVNYNEVLSNDEKLYLNGIIQKNSAELNLVQAPNGYKSTNHDALKVNADQVVEDESNFEITINDLPNNLISKPMVRSKPINDHSNQKKDRYQASKSQLQVLQQNYNSNTLLKKAVLSSQKFSSSKPNAAHRVPDEKTVDSLSMIPTVGFEDSVLDDDSTSEIISQLSSVNQNGKKNMSEEVEKKSQSTSPPREDFNSPFGNISTSMDVWSQVPAVDIEDSIFDENPTFIYSHEPSAQSNRPQKYEYNGGYIHDNWSQDPAVDMNDSIFDTNVTQGLSSWSQVVTVDMEDSIFDGDSFQAFPSNTNDQRSNKLINNPTASIDQSDFISEDDNNHDEDYDDFDQSEDDDALADDNDENQMDSQFKYFEDSVNNQLVESMQDKKPQVNLTVDTSKLAREYSNKSNTSMDGKATLSNIFHTAAQYVPSSPSGRLLSFGLNFSPSRSLNESMQRSKSNSSQDVVVEKNVEKDKQKPLPTSTVDELQYEPVVDPKHFIGASVEYQPDGTVKLTSNDSLNKMIRKSFQEIINIYKQPVASPPADANLPSSYPKPSGNNILTKQSLECNKNGALNAIDGSNDSFETPFTDILNMPILMEDEMASFDFDNDHAKHYMVNENSAWSKSRPMSAASSNNVRMDSKESRGNRYESTTQYPKDSLTNKLNTKKASKVIRAEDTKVGRGVVNPSTLDDSQELDKQFHDIGKLINKNIANINSLQSSKHNGSHQKPHRVMKNELLPQEVSQLDLSNLSSPGDVNLIGSKLREMKKKEKRSSREVNKFDLNKKDAAVQNVANHFMNHTFRISATFSKKEKSTGLNQLKEEKQLDVVHEKSTIPTEHESSTSSSQVIRKALPAESMPGYQSKGAVEMNGNLTRPITPNKSVEGITSPTNSSKPAAKSPNRTSISPSYSRRLQLTKSLDIDNLKPLHRRSFEVVNGEETNDQLNETVEKYIKRFIDRQQTKGPSKHETKNQVGMIKAALHESKGCEPSTSNGFIQRSHDVGHADSLEPSRLVKRIKKLKKRSKSNPQSARHLLPTASSLSKVIHK